MDERDTVAQSRGPGEYCTGRLVGDRSRMTIDSHKYGLVTMAGMDDPPATALERVEFLAASPARIRLLDAVAEGPAVPDALSERTGIPRSTLRRNLTALVDRGYLSHSATSGEYTLTVAGDVVRKALHEAVGCVDRADSLVPFLAHFPEDIPVEPSALADCEVVGSDSSDPFKPVSRIRARFGDSTTARGFLPAINPLYLQGLRTYADTDRTVELIAPRAAYDSRAADSPEGFRAVASAENIDLLVSEDVPDYAVGFLDGEVVLGAFDDHLRTHSVLCSEPGSAVADWAETRYEAVRGTAEELAR